MRLVSGAIALSGDAGQLHKRAGVVLMPRETSRARRPRRGTAGRLAAFVAPIAALVSAGAVVPHAQSTVARQPAHVVVSPAAGAGTRPGLGAVVSGISTVAGGLGGPAKATNVAIFPDCHLAFRAGSLYVADDGAVRRVSARTGWLTNLMGTGSVGPLGDGGPATKATVESLRRCLGPRGQPGDLPTMPRSAGSGWWRTRTGTFYGQAMTSRATSTPWPVAAAGRGGDGGPATTGEALHEPSRCGGGFRVGNLVIDRPGQSNGSGWWPPGPAPSTVKAYDRPGTSTRYGRPTATSSALSVTAARPWHAGLAPDGVHRWTAAGNLVIGDSANSRVRAVAGSTGTFYGQAMTKGDIYTDAPAPAHAGFSGDGGPATERRAERSRQRPPWTPRATWCSPTRGHERVRVLAEQHRQHSTASP